MAFYSTEQHSFPSSLCKLWASRSVHLQHFKWNLEFSGSHRTILSPFYTFFSWRLLLTLIKHKAMRQHLHCLTKQALSNAIQTQKLHSLFSKRREKSKKSEISGKNKSGYQKCTLWKIRGTLFCHLNTDHRLTFDHLSVETENLTTCALIQVSGLIKCKGLFRTPCYIKGWSLCNGCSKFLQAVILPASILLLGF